MQLSKSLLLLAAQSGLALSQSNSTNGTTDAAYLPLSTDDYFSYILYEALALANGGGAATGEVMRAAARIAPGDFESFYAEFRFLADQLHAKAASIDAARFPVSAREAYFRAASYYRMSVFFLVGNQSDPRLFDLWDVAVADFDAAANLTDVRGERVTVKGPDFDIPVIYWKSPKASDCGGNVPTVLVGSGYDAPQEESYHALGREVLDRGWNFATYEGPGQPTVRREQGLGFIPNWWDVVSPIVDYLETRPEVDSKRVALAGLSFGGTLAPLAASREHRLAAVLAIDGLASIQNKTLSQFPADLVALYASGNKTAFDKYMTAAKTSPEAPTLLKWFIDQGLWSFATDSPYDWMQRLGKISLDDPAVLKNVSCPVFVGKGQDDDFGGGQEQFVADMLGDKATLYEFKTDLGAGEHCQLGAEPQLAQATMDWLADVFDAVE
ncbi:alpha/beta-hydrolase [Hypoxylon sp. FL1284]|nr:alpha/beta-hydrolase [Hypoxylon sp. FL1284]